MITDISQFTEGDLLIEGISISENIEFSKMAINDSLEQFIKIREPEYLRSILGCEISRDLIAYIKNRPEEESDKVEKWENIISWFQNCEISPIACYIFFYYVRWSQTRATHLGTLKNNSDNPVVSNDEKLISAWNIMVTMNNYFIRWMEQEISAYPDWYFDDYLLEPINSFGI